MKPFASLLVANRGEIACRILRTARSEGLRTIAVYSDADAGAPHVALADEAVRIGPPPPKESYLDPLKILDAAEAADAEAIHPGYGFLSENSAFAEQVAAHGLVFVGPSPAAIALMGDKAAARALAARSGVPVLPGLDDPAADDAALIAAAPGIGLPLMVKAAAGGGGRGMRRVEALADLPEALTLARGEARAAFGDDALILERALDDARHVEVQVLADAHGTVLTLGERDCSVQRRRQKVLEEAPAPDLPDGVREALADAARRLAVAGGYVNAGTVEFLVSPTGEAFFLEMNARLQVEHPVTEAVAGLDLVALQLRIAQGRPLGLTQSEATLRGHAIEARLCAEDPAAGFLPSAGPLLRWRMPEAPGVRIDAGYAEGGEVPAVYDSLLAKVVTHGATREDALARLAAALRRVAVIGPRTNAAFLLKALEHRDFQAGGVSTRWLEAVFGTEDDPAATEAEAAVAAALWLTCARAEAHAAAARVSPSLLGWSSDGGRDARLSLRHDDSRWDFAARPTAAGWRLTAAARIEVEIEALGDGAARLRLDDARREVVFHRRSDAIDLAFGPRQLRFSRVVPGAADDDEAAGGRLTAPMHGRLARLDVAKGAQVAKGDPVAVLEAMKMQHRLTAPVAGRVVRIGAAEGAQMAAGDLLLEIEEETDAP